MKKRWLFRGMKLGLYTWQVKRRGGWQATFVRMYL